MTLQVPVEKAFGMFVNDLNSWWPKEYSWAGDVLEKIAIEPFENGRCFEVGPLGFQCDWGRVLEFQSPQRILFTWQIGPDRVPQPNPEKSSEIEVIFKRDAKRTRFVFIHGNFERHGEQAEKYREVMQSSHGWPYILEKFKQYVIRHRQEGE